MNAALEVTHSSAEFLRMKKKFRGFIGGFGSSKTYTGSIAQVQHFLEFPQVMQGYFAPTYRDIRDIYYQTIEEVAYLFGLQTDVKEGNHEVHFRNGPWNYGTSICRSMDAPSSIIGFKIGRALVDELDVLTMIKATLAVRKIIARLRWKESGVLNGADFTTTPEGYKAAYKLFVSDPQGNSNLNNFYGYVQASTYENAHNLPEGYIESLIATYPKELIQAYIHGQFTNLTTGTVYKSYNRITHDSKEVIQKSEQLHIGMDFNVGKMAAKVFVIRGEEWHCVEEMYDILDTPDMITEIKGAFHNHPIFVYPDASGDSRDSTNASISDISLLEQAGFRVRANPSNPRVKNSVMSVEKRFQLNKLYVNVKHCPRTANDLEQQAYNDNGEPDKKSGNDHGNDAFRYPITYMFPVARPVGQVPFTFTM